MHHSVFLICYFNRLKWILRVWHEIYYIIRVYNIRSTLNLHSLSLSIAHNRMASVRGTGDFPHTPTSPLNESELYGWGHPSHHFVKSTLHCWILHLIQRAVPSWGNNHFWQAKNNRSSSVEANLATTKTNALF